jgi:hypothetical protein
MERSTRRGWQLAAGLAVVGALVAWLLLPAHPGSETPSPGDSLATDSSASAVRPRVRPGAAVNDTHSATGGPGVSRGVSIQDLGTIVLSP